MMYRDTILSRLEQDLVGPHSPDEELKSRPSDFYLTGILWPKEAQMGDEEDDASFDEDDSGPSSPSLSGQQRPCSMGLSFAVDEETSRIFVKVDFGVYKLEEKSADSSDKKNTSWKRVPFHDVIEIDTNSPNNGSKSSHHQGPGDSSFEIYFRKQKIAAGWLCTVTLINGHQLNSDTPLDREETESLTLFQTQLELSLDSQRSFIPRPKSKIGKDYDSQMGALLYSSRKSYASGHQTSVSWSDIEPVSILNTNWIPSNRVPAFSESGSEEFADLLKGEKLSAMWLSTSTNKEVVEALSELTASYSNWIINARSQIAKIAEDLRSIAENHLGECESVRDRMNKGIRVLSDDQKAFQSFQLSMSAMHLQHSWKGIGDLKWRPFQMGFILLSLESTLNGESTEREVLDLLWFPTGGGKTEAYLALIAIASWYRKLAKGLGGCVAFMRYTLRLLTAQQFERASSLILACELLRMGKIHHSSLPADSNVSSFSIGLWVGGDATPNRFDEAMAFKNGSGKSSPEQLAKCPACGMATKWNYDSANKTVNPYCRTSDCLLGDTFGLWPVFTVDENLYTYRPTLLIGTVDKFAQITFKAETADMFRFRSPEAPDLVIQDELHLISGPLGTLVGIYETALDWLLTKEGVRPKIIGSTATIKKASEQVQALFDRKSCQFPPPGLDAEDSGFAVVDWTKPGRVYAGVSTAGRSAKFALQAVGGSLMQSGGKLPEVNDLTRDGYSTLLYYFNSLRELGGAIVQILDDVPDSIALYASARDETARDIPHSEEMTSRKSQDEILRILEELKKTCDQEYPVDAVLATNMVSVGVDISRLGLMLVNGQPKTRAEYIQATSRVGRSNHPGLIVTVMNAAKPRDRSHYETFQTWHSAIYKDVEATSVTPFAPRARDRALKAVIVTMLRQGVLGLSANPVDPSSMPAGPLAQIVAEIERRVTSISPAEVISVQKEVDEALFDWERRKPTHYENRAKPLKALIQRAEEFARKVALHRTANPGWPVMNSMRTVEPSTPFRLTERLSSSGLTKNGSDAATDDERQVPHWRIKNGEQ